MSAEALQLLKTAHIISAALLLGTGLGIAFFCWFGYRLALRNGEIAALRATLRLTVIADACFIAPAVVFQAASGVMLMQARGWPLFSAWSLGVWFLFVLTGICWLPVVVIQLKLSREAQRVAAISSLSPAFHRAFRHWFALGVPAFAAMLGLYYLMVAKPLAVG